MENVQRYVVAVGRNSDDEEVAHILAGLADIDGVHVIGSWGRRAQLEATVDGIREVRSRIGDRGVVEPAVWHRPSHDAWK